jgi:hypothetical protein
MDLDATERFDFAARTHLWRDHRPTVLAGNAWCRHRVGDLRRTSAQQKQQNKRLLFAARRDSVHFEPQRVAIWQLLELQPSC